MARFSNVRTDFFFVIFMPENSNFYSFLLETLHFWRNVFFSLEIQILSKLHPFLGQVFKNDEFAHFLKLFGWKCQHFMTLSSKIWFFLLRNVSLGSAPFLVDFYKMTKCSYFFSEILEFPTFLLESLLFFFNSRVSTNI